MRENVEDEEMVVSVLGSIRGVPYSQSTPEWGEDPVCLYSAALCYCSALCLCSQRHVASVWAPGLYSVNTAASSCSRRSILSIATWRACSTSVKVPSVRPLPGDGSITT